jgi:hypothetical protein
MTRRTIPLAICVHVALGAHGVASPAAGPVVGVVQFAIVIGNNAAESGPAATLQFADDDALATHRLLEEAGARSILLTRFDASTRHLAPDALSHGPPRWSSLLAAFERFAGEMQRERAAGRDVELLLFYSGHGDVEHGEGYVLLEDRHLTRRDLATLLARSRASRNHVIVDACKSYFVVFEKRPGGRRERFEWVADPEAANAEYFWRTGFILSTSSERDSHEWERFGGGVFSHQVQSALRGAADIDGDGEISYAELGAFLTTANQAITNRRLRPDFLLRPPAGIAENLAVPVLRWGARDASTTVLDQPVGHVFVEAATGERVLDVHVAGSERVTLRVPSGRPLFVRGKHSARDYVIRTREPVRVSALADQPSSVLEKGGAAALALEQLFSVAFDRDSVQRFTTSWRDARTSPDDGTDDAASAHRRWARVQTAAGVTALAAGIVTVGAAALMFQQYLKARSPSLSQVEIDEVRASRMRAGLATAIAAPVALAAAAVWQVARSRSSAAHHTAPLQVRPFGGASGVGLAIERSW